MQDLSVFLFRRDLRLSDNSGLIAAMHASKKVMPVFIVDPALVANWSNANARLSFLGSALKNLDHAIARHGGRLQVLQGNPAEVLSKLLHQHKVDSVYTNRDYTPLARSRDKQLKTVSETMGVAFPSYGDQLLNEPEAVTKADGLPYTVFTPYFRRAKDHHIPTPTQEAQFNFGECEAGIDFETSLLGPYLAHPTDPGMLSVDKALARINSLEDYDETKDLPGENGTSRLSALLRFGLCSVREVYHSTLDSHSLSHGLIRQLYWRDFYFQVGYHFPHVYKSAFRKKYDRLAWDHNPHAFKAWQQGETGFPIVDAGMRELLATGYMHNRVRMIVASFLTKNLQIDWRKGERHFARYLIDFDPALNNGNWQWGASTGCDAQPYFRVFNPWRQQLRFDKDCAYIKHWLPELRGQTPRQIHALEKDDAGYRTKIVNLKSSSEKSKRRFKALADS